MKLLKLGFISVIAFGLLFWMITLLFPSNTIISRVKNIAGNADTLYHKITSNEISLQTLIAGKQPGLIVKDADLPFYEDNLFNSMGSDALPKADTIFFNVSKEGKAIVQGGLAFYQLHPDSVTTQMFYVFQTPWYNPLQKMKLMVGDKVYGPGLDSALMRLKLLIQY